ncbi:hypothetical protein ACH4SP_19720 [Streptomyces sp. NPDC021093]|uniref:hypothetical protein n=1 Tax=Streptomyces sp. NPDC021093 TaxID=3365112 RepID=UPI0037BB1262
MVVLLVVGVAVLFALGFSSPVWWLVGAVVLYGALKYGNGVGGGGGAAKGGYGEYRERREQRDKWDRRYRRQHRGKRITPDRPTDR